ncbi:MAG: methylenetetrahydrofolate reductase [Clostridia bacterium]|nr:methylenetetrahydrofolate reductase [NAD(P)H] [Clostridia bacterium]
MKIKDLLQPDKLTISCEVFPPKDDTAYENVYSAVEEIAALKPDFISVTYGAGGGTSKNTVKIASAIQHKMNVTALAHLTCVSSTPEEISQHLVELKENGIENVLALRGDLPKDGRELPGHYKYASQLIEQIHRESDLCVGAACYPDGHVECAHKEDDLDNLRRKVDCGVDFLTTQMFFDNNALYSFMYRAMRKGIHVPILAGIMPVTNARQVARSCELSGTHLHPRFKAIVDRFGDNPAAMEQAGIAYATDQIIDLIANGVNWIHLYTMNKPHIAAKILGNLSEIWVR